jgi:hypothetical protein
LTIVVKEHPLLANLDHRLGWRLHHHHQIPPHRLVGQLQLCRRRLTAKGAKTDHPHPRPKEARHGHRY